MLHKNLVKSKSVHHRLGSRAYFKRETTKREIKRYHISTITSGWVKSERHVGKGGAEKKILFYFSTQRND